MRINCKTKARVKKYNGVYNETKDGTVREVDLEIGRSYKEFEEMFGEQLAEVVFGAYVNDDAGSDGVWALKTPKPSNRIVCENHKITIGENAVTCKPKVRAFVPIDDTAKVVAVIRLELGRAQVEMRRQLEDSIGHDLPFEIEPTDMPLPLGENMVNSQPAQMEIVKGGAPA